MCKVPFYVLRNKNIVKAEIVILFGNSNVLLNESN